MVIVRVTDSGGHTTSVRVADLDNYMVMDLQAELAEVTGTPVERQRLFVEGMESALKGQMLLVECGLGHGCGHEGQPGHPSVTNEVFLIVLPEQLVCKLLSPCSVFLTGVDNRGSAALGNMHEMDEVYGGAAMRPPRHKGDGKVLRQRKTVFFLPEGAEVCVAERALVVDKCDQFKAELLVALRLEAASVEQYCHALVHDPYHCPDASVEIETNRTVAEAVDLDVNPADVDAVETQYYILIGDSGDAIPFTEVELLAYGDTDTLPAGALRNALQAGRGDDGLQYSPSLSLPFLHDCNQHFSTERLANLLEPPWHCRSIANRARTHFLTDRYQSRNSQGMLSSFVEEAIRVYIYTPYYTLVSTLYIGKHT